MSNSGISICLIVKNVAKSLRDCLGSLSEFRKPEDELIIVDTGSSDGTQEIAKEFNATVYEHPELNKPGMLDLVKQHLPDFFEQCSEDPQFSDGFINDFAAARELSFQYAKNDLLFWIDGDDILVGGKLLREVIPSFFQDPRCHALFLRYEYSFLPDGACETELWRERVIRKGTCKWVGRCHETLIPTVKDWHVSKLTDSEVCIQHKFHKPHVYSDIRNYVILLNQWNENLEADDPTLNVRTAFYLGNAARGLAQGKTGSPWYKVATKWYEWALPRSGSMDDRISMLLNIGYMYLQHGRAWKAIDYFQKTIKLNPSEPRAYFGIAHAYHDLQRYNDCIIFTKFGRDLGIPNYITSVDPLQFDYYPIIFEIESLKKLKQFDLAISLGQHLIQRRPNFKPLQEALQELIKEAQKYELVNSIELVSKNLFSKQAYSDIIQRLRPELRKVLPDYQIENHAPPPKKHVTFLCAGHWENWDPSSLENGIGGSEKMVIQIARGLANRGWNVDVYGNPYPKNAYKSFNKVIYRPVQSFNGNFDRDNLVLWRSPALLDIAVKANRFFVDMHDVSTDHEWTKDRIQKLTGVFFKSKYHRQTAPSIPEEKIIYSRNGIDLCTLPETNKRNLNKIVWLSAPDRGLLQALRIFERVKKTHKNAEFHIYYGFAPLYGIKAASQEYEWIGEERAIRHMLEYQEEVFEKAEELDVVFHNRVGHSTLMKELSTSSIWLYPTTFPEISCISAMEVQASGVLPISSHTAALAETLNYGVKIDPLDIYEAKEAVCSILDKGSELDDYRKQMQEVSRKRFDLNDLLTQWEEALTK